MWSNLSAHPRRARLVVGLFILQFGVVALMAPAAGRMGQRGVSVLDLQFMRTPAKAAEYVATLGPDGVDAARLGLYLDFPYLVLYALALSALCVLLAAKAAERGRESLAAAGRTVAWFAPVAAGCDAVEDIAILVVLGGNVEQPWPAIAFGFASVKWALLAVVIGYVIIALALAVRRRVPNEAPATEE